MDFREENRRGQKSKFWGLLKALFVFRVLLQSCIKGASQAQLTGEVLLRGGLAITVMQNADSDFLGPTSYFLKHEVTWMLKMLGNF